MYGIANCDKVRAARKWFSGRNIDVEFHDYKKSGVDASVLAHWLTKYAWSELLNRSGSTWRGLSETRRSLINSESEAVKAMTELPSLIKRPVIEQDEEVIIGFDPTRFGG